MAASWQFKALMRKNILISRRNKVSTIAELLFPVILMIFIFLIRQAFSETKMYFEDKEGSDETYIQTKSTSYPSIDILNSQNTTDNYILEFPLSPLVNICRLRPLIGAVGTNFPNKLKNKISELIQFTDPSINYTTFYPFPDIPALEDYIQSPEYGSDDKLPICFAIYFNKVNSSYYNYSLHYFDSSKHDGIRDVPSMLSGSYDEFQKEPLIDPYEKYLASGYQYIQKIISEYILQEEEQNDNVQINSVMIAQKYEMYKQDYFGSACGIMFSFFTVIAYICPLCLNVYKMVNEKETKVKEGMKIMGLSESVYFLSFFVQFFIKNIFYSVVNSIIISLTFGYTPFVYLLGIFFLFGMDVFALSFFLQSFIDKTRLAIILSILVYFVMFIMSILVYEDDVTRGVKTAVSIFPPVGIMLGAMLISEFESKFEKIKPEYLDKEISNYTINSMYLMFFIDFFIYLFLGYYLQNIVSHQFGIKRPWYFLCTRSYWCKGGNKERNKKMMEKINNMNMNNEIKTYKTRDILNTNNEMNRNSDDNTILNQNLSKNINPDDFESEDLYKEKTKSDDVLKILNLYKIFDDGKVAVNDLSFNLYKNEIFALLGHNGAGKTTTINMLSGLYEATSGEAIYDGYNILDDVNMDNFRKILGICPQQDVLFDDLTVVEHLKMFCYFKGVESSKIDDEVYQILNDFRFDPSLHNVIAKNLSAGQRRKLSISIAVVGGSQIIFLDEPSSGMDITSRRNLWEILKRINENKIIILTTHFMEEASVLGNRIGIISEGKMRCLGSPLFLIQRFGKYMSVNVTKEQGADNNTIINFFKEYAPNCESEAFSEEILFRIPKRNAYTGNTDSPCRSPNRSPQLKHRKANNEDSDFNPGNSPISKYKHKKKVKDDDDNEENNITSKDELKDETKHKHHHHHKKEDDSKKNKKEFEDGTNDKKKSKDKEEGKKLLLNNNETSKSKNKDKDKEDKEENKKHHKHHHHKDKKEDDSKQYKKMTNKQDTIPRKKNHKATITFYKDDNEKSNLKENDINFDIDLAFFFDNLDKNLKSLKIKSYSASMPTLEDVFLNVAAIEKKQEDSNKETENFKSPRKPNKGNYEELDYQNSDNDGVVDTVEVQKDDNDKILFETDYNGGYSELKKFNMHVSAVFIKRFKQSYRDLKSFLMEILCPIILIIIGCGMSKVEFDSESPPFDPSLTIMGKDQKVFYTSMNNENVDFLNKLIDTEEYSNDIVSNQLLNENTSIKYKNSYSLEFNKIITFFNSIFDKGEKKNYASFYLYNNDVNSTDYAFLLDLRVRQGPLFFNQYFLTKVINSRLQLYKNKKITINFSHIPFPHTAKEKIDDSNMSNSIMVFFVSIAFALIPANFVCLLVKERSNNSKHLMKVSGVSLLAYWFTNYIFELLKYFVTAGVSLLVIKLFDFYEKYFYILVILYGPSLISFSYMISFIFDTESDAQNVVILLNFFIGGLGSTILVMLRTMDNTVKVAKLLINIFNLVPSFAFSYGFMQLLSKLNLFYYDNPTTWMFLKDEDILDKEYLGKNIIAMTVETFVYMIILIIIEKFQNTFSEVEDDDQKNDSTDKINDSIVLAENQKVNSINTNDMEKSTKKNYSYGRSVDNSQDLNNYAVVIKNLSKNFKKAGEDKCCSCNCINKEKVEALKNLSFSVEHGECFGLLGLNGAGKTTTFKCLTGELAPNHGSIYINGIKTAKNFLTVRKLFGYCPQFDAIFEYMTVYENLKFYAKLKCVQEEKMHEIIISMLKAMSLLQYKDKVSGNLSGGNKRKLSVAISMICNPPIILLDEPSTGMDPEARRFMWAIIHKISKRKQNSENSLKSSVIMTTHSMDEAENLCRRIGIMVNGQFVCLGTSNQIKEKYGYGFEIDIRIMPLKEEKLNKYLNKVNLDKNYKVTKENILKILKSLDYEGFKDQLGNDKIGKNIFKEMETAGFVYLYNLLTWIYYVRCAMRMIYKIKWYFDEIYLTEFIENNFLFKIKKNEDAEKNKSIGFLFGLLEKKRNEYNITEYSIQQTSLEQIFNKFAANQGKNKEDEMQESKVEILITNELLNQLIE